MEPGGSAARPGVSRLLPGGGWGGWLAGGWLAECGCDLTGDEVGLITYRERREPQYPVAADSEVVVAAHVGPPGGRLHMPEAVHLRDEPGVVPVGVEPSVPACGVPPEHLPVGLGDALPAGETAKVQLR